MPSHENCVVGEPGEISMVVRPTIILSRSGFAISRLVGCRCSYLPPLVAQGKVC